MSDKKAKIRTALLILAIIVILAILHFSGATNTGFMYQRY